MIDVFQVACFRSLETFQLLGQGEPGGIDPDREMAKARMALGLVGLFVLFVGMFLVFWLFSRYMRRMVSGNANSIESSRYSEFGYQHYERLDREQKRRDLNEDN